MLTIADIPDKYRKGQTDGENIARLASGVQTAIREAVGDEGLNALTRFVQAGFLFRSSEIGRVMIGDYTTLGGPLRETAQLVNFAGGALSASTLVGAVDLTAAAMRRLYLGPVNDPDDGREADLVNFAGVASQGANRTDRSLISVRLGLVWAAQPDASVVQLPGHMQGAPVAEVDLEVLAASRPLSLSNLHHRLRLLSPPGSARRSASRSMPTTTARSVRSSSQSISSSAKVCRPAIPI